MRQKWEYDRRVISPEEHCGRVLSEMGDDGWELVSSYTEAHKSYSELIAIFKRPQAAPQMIDDYEEAEKIAARVIAADSMDEADAIHESLARLERGVCVLCEWALSRAIDRKVEG